MSAHANVLVLGGHGLNCEDETLRAFESAGASGRIAHVDDLAANTALLNDAQILAVPGGFSFGDHTGAGKALANLLTGSLADAIRSFLEKDRLAIGICNGCQALVKSGLFDREGAPAVSIAANAGGTYQCRWVHLETVESSSPWLSGIDRMFVPIAHGEGRFVANKTLPVALKYTICSAPERSDDAIDGLPVNPNGSQMDCAAITGYDGRVLAMMPHPERALRFDQRPDWTRVREQLRRAGQPVPQKADGAALFENAVKWFS